MSLSKSLIGTVLGAVVAVLWVVFDGGAVLLVVAFAAAGWLLGSLLEDPSRLISLLQRLQDE